MSHPARLVSELPEGNYEISFVFTPNIPVGVISDEHVRIGAPVWVWHIKPVAGSPAAHRLSLVNAAPYTAERAGDVIVTTNFAEDRVWYIYEWEGKYEIAAAPIWPSPVWTASSATPGSQVLLRSYVPNKPPSAENQLLKLKKLEG